MKEKHLLSLILLFFITFLILLTKNNVAFAQILPPITLPPILPIAVPSLPIPSVAIPTAALPPVINFNESPQPTSQAPQSLSNPGGTTSTTHIINISERSNATVERANSITNMQPFQRSLPLDVVNKKGVFVLDKIEAQKGKIVLSKEVTEVLFLPDSLSPDSQPLVFIMPPEKDIAIVFNFGAFLTNDEFGTQHVILPRPIRMEQLSNNASVSVTLPQNVDISLSPDDCRDEIWDGTLTSFIILPPSAVNLQGKTISIPIEIGRNDCGINLSKQAILIFKDQRDWQVGYRSRNQENVTEITAVCPVLDYGDCISREGRNLLVKTSHFTQFVTFKKSTFWTNFHSLIANNNLVALGIATVSTLLLALFLGNLSILRKIGTIEEVDKQKNEYVSLASHELRTPMTVIKGWVSMILNGNYGPVNKSMQKPLEAIQTSTQNSMNLVNDMLDVSRLESGKINLALITFPIEPLITEVTTSLQPLAKDKGILLETKNLDTTTVQGDKDKVRQVLVNLVANALKYTEKGSVSLSSKVTKDIVTIFITDSGIGIPKDEQTKLFQKFNRVSNQQTQKQVGTGLGLYITRNLMRKMGGDVWLEESDSGKGSTFALSILQPDAALAKKLLSKNTK